MPTPALEKTHDEVKKPQMDIRHLADYMAAQGRERARRTIVQKCRYRKRAQAYNHQEAKRALRAYFRTGGGADLTALTDQSQALREKLTDGPYERNLADYNADYLDAFVAAYQADKLPAADLLPPQQFADVIISGVRVKVDIFASFRRTVQRSNKVRVGALMLRYAKGEALPVAVGEWQSAILFGYLKKYGNLGAATAEEKLCATLCAVSGEIFCAPSGSTNKFLEAEAACASISEAWANIAPPAGAVL